MRLFFIYFIVSFVLSHQLAASSEKNIKLSELDFKNDLQQIEKNLFEIDNSVKKNDIAVELLRRQYRLFFRVSVYILDVENKNSNVIKERRLILSSWLAYHNCLLILVDSKHDPLKLPYVNISPGKGPYSSGIAPENIKEPDIRKEYEKKLKNNSEYTRKFNLQHTLRYLIPRSIEESREFIIRSYSKLPRAGEELVELLNKYEYPEEEKAKIFKALNIPYKGFREWRTNDGLLTLTAKLISADKNEVKLEKEDGKKITIEIAYLRKEDQDYVKKQREPKTKTSP
jgi:hypothetical protein